MLELHKPVILTTKLKTVNLSGRFNYITEDIYITFLWRLTYYIWGILFLCCNYLFKLLIWTFALFCFDLLQAKYCNQHEPNFPGTTSLIWSLLPYCSNFCLFIFCEKFQFAEIYNSQIMLKKLLFWVFISKFSFSKIF